MRQFHSNLVPCEKKEHLLKWFYFELCYGDVSLSLFTKPKATLAARPFTGITESLDNVNSVKWFFGAAEPGIKSSGHRSGLEEQKKRKRLSSAALPH